jgi:hypothetical protein
MWLDAEAIYPAGTCDIREGLVRASEPVMGTSGRHVISWSQIKDKKCERKIDILHLCVSDPTVQSLPFLCVQVSLTVLAIN